MICSFCLNVRNYMKKKNNVTMILNVHSTETGVKFVSTKYDFYECDNHKMCVACTNSSWACDWCIYSNICTHDNSTCSEDGPASIIGGVNNPSSGPDDGFEFCPQLAPQTKDVLVAVGVERLIEVTIYNLPPDKVNDYGCILNVEGKEQETSASRAGNLITCGAKAYSYDQEVNMLDVRLTLVWNMNGDDDRKVDDYMDLMTWLYFAAVALYKCEVGRPDCSRCLSNITTMPELGCGWCQTDRICSVRDSSECTGTWIPPNTNMNCPSPMLTGVSPPSGPFEGDTIIAVSGTDLGQKFADILSVEVGGAACSTEGLEDIYMTGSSVGCRTMAGETDAEAEIVVKVMGSDGTPQYSTGEVIFTYRDPSISSFEPAEGPADGGTLVNIEGMYLDAGYKITGMIGPNNCIVDKNTITETSATCRTGKGTAGESHTVKMYFDGAERESEDTFTFRPNPQVFDVQPRASIQSGGRKVTVTGANLRLAQDPVMIVYSEDTNFTDSCDVMNDTIMHCKTPKTDVKYQELMMRTSNRKKRAAEEPTKLEFGFLIGDVQSLQDWSSKNNVTLDIYVDPTYEKFKANPDKYNGSILILMGQNLDYASSKEDVKVYVGREEGHVQSLDETTLTCKIPETDPGAGDFKGNQTEQGYPYVYVVHGNLEFEIGGLQYPIESLPLEIIIIGILTAVVALALISFPVLYKIKLNRIMKKNQDVLDRLRTLQKELLAIQALSKSEGVPSSHVNLLCRSVVLSNNVTIDADDVRIAYSQIKLGKALGNGAFGKVYEASLQSLENEAPRKVAIKTMKDASDPSVTIKFLEEGLIMKDFDHTNVLGLIGLTFDPQGNPLVILPLMRNGDLKSFLKKAPVEVKNNLVQLTTFAMDAAKGMEYLSGRNFVHRDLAARNCMIDENLIVKIADFGLSRDMNESDYYISTDVKAKLPVKWMAPESIGKRVYNHKTDVWSFGVLLWEIFSHGERPYIYVANRDMYYHLEQGNRLFRPPACHQDMYKIMLDCWGKDPKQRPSFSVLVRNLASHKAMEETNAAAVQSLDEPDDEIMHSYFLNTTNPTNSYLELEPEPSDEPGSSCTADDNVVSIEMDTITSRSDENICTQEATTEDYVNESVIKLRTKASVT
ncbi:hepatocyte growth factor receptor-like [Amphiura filiformis]|uniref:hepatocyte growth factor receptor-like n=1 Tax=Amphiura filiformis TaxID=82378 RepID=UPI003B2236D7